MKTIVIVKRRLGTIIIIIINTNNITIDNNYFTRLALKAFVPGNNDVDQLISWLKRSNDAISFSSSFLELDALAKYGEKIVTSVHLKITDGGYDNNYDDSNDGSDDDGGTSPVEYTGEAAMVMSISPYYDDSADAVSSSSSVGPSRKKARKNLNSESRIKDISSSESNNNNTDSNSDTTDTNTTPYTKTNSYSKTATNSSSKYNTKHSSTIDHNTTNTQRNIRPKKYKKPTSSATTTSSTKDAYVDDGVTALLGLSNL